MARKTTTPDNLLAVAERLTKLAAASPEKRFTALADQADLVKTTMAMARQDALLAWVDDLTAKGRTRAEAVVVVMDKVKLSRTGVYTVLLAAERRAGRPKQAPGRPTREATASKAASTPAPAQRKRISHAGHDHPQTPAGRLGCRKASAEVLATDLV